MRGQKGITLVALIITIIVLLILAVVAITTVKGDGILGHANNAVNKFGNAQENEQAYLNWANDYITEQTK